MQSFVCDYIRLKPSVQGASSLTWLTSKDSSLVLHIEKVPLNAADDGYTK